jgi:NADH-quinone oxidoreductase subunit H
MSGAQFLRAIVGIVGLIALMGLNTLFMDWWERKVVGHAHVRHGPFHHGWHGLLQPFADMVKMLGKEDIRPTSADAVFFWFAPGLPLVAAFVGLAAIPFAPGIVLADMKHGLFFIFAVQTVMPFGFTLVGWAANNKWSLIGSLRSAAQLISYEIPMLIAAMAVVLTASSMRLTEIVDKQATLWYVVKQPVGFVIFFVTMLAEMNRAPFDLPEAESELVAGYHTEYSGMKFGLVMMAEYTAMLLGSLLIALLYLGGWLMPMLPASPLWLMVKTYLVMTLMVWIRATYPRIRVDRMMEMSWKYLIPVSLANLLVVAIIATLVPGF